MRPQESSQDSTQGPQASISDWIRWSKDPVSYASERLGIELTEDQQKIARAIVKNDRVAVRSGQKTGKSNLAAVLALWWIETRPDSIVIMTAASYRQVERVLWRELRRLVYRAGVIGRAEPFPQPAKKPETGLRYDDERLVIGFTADDENKMQGFSSPHLLYILDEASGIEEQMFGPIIGNTASSGKIIMFSNPTLNVGTFAEAFRKPDVWRLFHLSSWNTPNAISGKRVVPGLAERKWCEGRKKEWGEQDPRYQVRVLGNFPSESSNTVISLGVLEGALERFRSLLVKHGIAEPDEDNFVNVPELDNHTCRVDLAPLGGVNLKVGVDVAHFGDDKSEISCSREGAAYIEHEASGKPVTKYEPPIAFVAAQTQGWDTQQVAELVVRVVRTHRRHQEPVTINVDIIGYGAGVYDALSRMKLECEDGFWDFITIIGFNVSEKPQNEEDNVTKRDEMWFDGAAWLKSGALCPDKHVETQLLAPQYDIVAKGKRKVESKKEIKKRLNESTDGADSILMSVADSTVRPRAVPKAINTNVRLAVSGGHNASKGF